MDETLTEEFSPLFYQTTGTCLRSNGDICSLPINDRSVLLRTGANLDLDQTLIKVAPLLELFSENTWICPCRTPSDHVNSNVIFRIQNTCMEISFI